jgi:hypothetical protein
LRKLVFPNWTGETFTRNAQAPGHVAASSQAFRSIQLPRLLDEPASSAIGMNTAGETAPRVGCCQRIKASTPVIRLVVVFTIG